MSWETTIRWQEGLLLADFVAELVWNEGMAPHDAFLGRGGLGVLPPTRVSSGSFNA